MIAVPQNHFSIKEYLQWEEQQEEKPQLSAGLVPEPNSAPQTEVATTAAVSTQQQLERILPNTHVRDSTTAAPGAISLMPSAEAVPPGSMQQQEQQPQTEANQTAMPSCEHQAPQSQTFGAVAPPQPRRCETHVSRPTAPAIVASEAGARCDLA